MIGGPGLEHGSAEPENHTSVPCGDGRNKVCRGAHKADESMYIFYILPRFIALPWRQTADSSDDCLVLTLPFRNLILLQSRCLSISVM